MGTANIYVPNDSPARCLLWKALPRELSQACRLILLGDFNMVERRADKTRQNASMIPMCERILFNALKTSLNVDDPPQSAHSLPYSWHNMPNIARFLARLYQCYVFYLAPNTFDRLILHYRVKQHSALGS